MLQSQIDFFNFLGRYSVFFILVYPIYLFSVGDENDYKKLSVCLVAIGIVITTYFYWIREWKKNYFWKYADRILVLTLVILLLVFGKDETWPFIVMSALFYTNGYMNSFTNQNSYICHTIFRFFAGVALNQYITEAPYSQIFLGISAFLTFLLLLAIVLQVKSPKRMTILI